MSASLLTPHRRRCNNPPRFDLFACSSGSGDEAAAAVVCCCCCCCGERLRSAGHTERSGGDGTDRRKCRSSTDLRRPTGTGSGLRHQRHSSSSASSSSERPPEPARLRRPPATPTAAARLEIGRQQQSNDDQNRWPCLSFFSSSSSSSSSSLLLLLLFSPAPCTWFFSHPLVPILPNRWPTWRVPPRRFEAVSSGSGIQTFNKKRIKALAKLKEASNERHQTN